MAALVDCSISDALTRQKSSGILTPESEPSLRRDGSPESISRKRKRDDDHMESLFNEPFVIKPYPSTVFDKPRTLRPVALLPRDQLSLSCLDLFPQAHLLPESRLYEANVKILELESRMRATPLVLIARLDDGRSYFAIELQSRGLCVLCKLGTWIDLSALYANALMVFDVPRPTKRDYVPSFKGIQAQKSSTSITPSSSRYDHKKRLAIEAFQSVVKRPSLSVHPEPQDSISSGATPALTPQDVAPVERVGSMSEAVETASPSLGDILENIRTQYLEALYLSKTCLAYFAKGPLSRARAAFHLDLDCTLDMKDLIEFLETIILPPVALEKKYKEGVTCVVSTLDLLGVQSANEASKDISRKRRVKKMKLGKNGLYPNEDSLIRQWWEEHNNDEGPLLGISLEEIRRQRVASLRTRETQLQMIVILETLALQSHAAPQEMIENALPGTADMSISRSVAVKSKKLRDLPALVDLHVDRLCIWQSVATEESSGARNSDTDARPNSGLTIVQTNATDVLGEFCVEVITPFYSARLPDLSNTINRKLGGPVAITPARPKVTRVSSTTESSKPGAAIKRSAPIKQPRSLQRALTNDRHSRSASRGPSGAISLMRSATLPSVPGLKREASETPSLSSIPSTDSQGLHVSRSGVAKSRKFSSREVDLKNLANGNELKSKKDVIEAELKDVISAIRKPNRQLAGHAHMETIERRTLGAAQSRKSRKPVRNALCQGVQIMATPKVHRQKDVFGYTQPVDDELQDNVFQTDIVPPSSLPRVPASVTRPLSKGRTNERSGRPIVVSTPSRTFLRSNFNDVSFVPPSSPLQVRDKYSQLHYDTASSVEKTTRLQTNIHTGGNLVTATPQKVRKLNLDGVATCPDSVQKSMHDSKSMPPETNHDDNDLYKALGWDDIDDFA